jgi:hypothetical protein
MPVDTVHSRECRRYGPCGTIGDDDLVKGEEEL